MIDTPGFDDSYRTDEDILSQVASFLATFWSSSVQLTGLIYCHSIIDTRFGTAADRNLGMFKQLCGPDAMSSVVLTSTFWDLADQERANYRETELLTLPCFWAGMISHGSASFRHDRGKTSGSKIVQYLMNRHRPVVLSLQQEIVDQGKTLAETKAGQIVALQIRELRLSHQNELAKLQEQHQRALREQEALWQQRLLEMQVQIQAGSMREIPQTQSQSRFQQPAGQYSQPRSRILSSQTGQSSSQQPLGQPSEHHINPGHQFGAATISDSATAVMGNISHQTQQSFYIKNATLVFGENGNFRGIKRPRSDSEDCEERDRIKSILREFLSA